MSKLPTAKDLQAKIALSEAEKASAAVKAQAAADAEKQAFLDRLSNAERESLTRRHAE
jgi:hypothetical protein